MDFITLMYVSAALMVFAIIADTLRGIRKAIEHHNEIELSKK